MGDWFEKIYQTQSDDVHNYALHLANGNPRVIQEIPDIVQKVFALLFQKRVILFNHPNIEAWLFTTTQLLVLKANSTFAKTDRREPFSRDDPDALDQSALAEAAIVLRQNAQTEQTDNVMVEIEEAIDPEDYKLLMAYYDPNTKEGELAQSLGIRKSTLRKRVSRLLIALRRTQKFLCFFLVSMSQIPF